MWAQGFLCLAGTEIGNVDRTFAYVVNNEDCDPRIEVVNSEPCICDLLDEGPYISPAEDDAPWYVAERPDAGEFLGLWPRVIEVDRSMSRRVTDLAAGGGVLDPLRLSAKVISVEGIIYATSQRGMAWGETWLTEALRGSYCQDGCSVDQLEILPACPDAEESDLLTDSYFRTLLGVGIADGPKFSPIASDFPQDSAQLVTFQFVAGSPYLFGAPEEQLDETIAAGNEETVTSAVDCWPGEATHVITIEGVSLADVTVTGRTSLDGVCPPGNAGGLCFSFRLPALQPNQTLTVDGRRRRATITDHAGNAPRSAFPDMLFEGPFRFPDMAPSQTLCIEIAVTTGSVNATVTKYDREV